MSYVNQGLGGDVAPVVKHFLRRYSRHAAAPVVAPVVQAMIAEGVNELAAQTPAVGFGSDVQLDASEVAKRRGGIFGQPQGVFGPMLGALPGRRRRRRRGQRLAGVGAAPMRKTLKPGEYRSVSLVRSYFPWISPGELVDDGAASFSVAAQGVNWVRLNFYDRGGILVDQQDFYPVTGMSGLLVPNFLASMGPPMLRPAPAADVAELQLDAMDAGVPTDAGTAGMGSYRRGGLGALMVSTQGDPVKTPVPVQDSKGTITSVQGSGAMVSASTRTLQQQLRKVGAGCIAMDGKWGPNTAGAFARWAASSSQNSRAQRSLTSTAAPAVGAQTVYIDDVAKRTLAAESTGRTDECGSSTSTSTSTTTLVDQISPDMVVVDGGGEGVPGWVWGVSAAILGVGVLGAVAVAKSGGKDVPAASKAAAPRKTARKTTRRAAPKKKTTRRKPTRKTPKRATSKRKTSKRYR